VTSRISDLGIAIPSFYTIIFAYKTPHLDGVLSCLPGECWKFGGVYKRPRGLREVIILGILEVINYIIIKEKKKEAGGRSTGETCTVPQLARKFLPREGG